MLVVLLSGCNAQGNVQDVAEVTIYGLGAGEDALLLTVTLKVVTTSFTCIM